jgi:NAD-dependent dihydropyrimidine dehydrogenase PreA subunit
VKLLLKFNAEIIKRPIISETVLETGAKLDIERARVEGPQGEIVVNVPDDSCREVVSVLRRKNVEVTRLDVPVTKDEENCIHCGACVSVCPVGAIAYEYDWRVRMDDRLCVQCGNCVTACPVRVLKLSV